MDSAGTPSGEDGAASGDADDGGRETSAGGDASAEGGDSATADAGFLGENELTPFTYDGVNSVAFAQLPGSADGFLGRYQLGQTPSGDWAVANYTMNWTAQPQHLSLTGYAFQPPLAIVGGAMVTTAYDPTVASFGGEVWVAFECGGMGIVGASSCIGPYANGSIDRTRTTVAVQGDAAQGCMYGYSASVPKLLAFQGNLYVYWTVVEQLCSDGSFVGLTSNGAELEETAGLMWVAGTTGTISTIDPDHTIEVWGLGTSSESNVTADMQGVFTDGQHVFATAGLGGNAGGQSCVNPIVGNTGCYRLGLSSSLSPLGPDIFAGPAAVNTAGDQLGVARLISNPQSYTRAFTAPDGSLRLMTTLYGATPGTVNPIAGPTNGAPESFTYPVTNDAAFFAPQASPAGAQFFGSMSGQVLAAPVVGFAATPDGLGYWLVGSDGGVFNFGDAMFYGSMGGGGLTAPVVGMAATPDGQGYWLVGSDGNVYAFGPSAVKYGSLLGMALNEPVVGMAAGVGGYWLVASDGGIFSFGVSGFPFYGSTGGMTLNKPIVGMAAAPNGSGYWLVASDGGIFSFPSTLPFFGSTGSMTLNAPIVGMAAAANGQGYWLVGSDGGIFAFGSGAAFRGSMGGQGLGAQTIGVAPAAGGGYWIAGANGSIFNF
jgi:hypothetical protein